MYQNKSKPKPPGKRGHTNKFKTEVVTRRSEPEVILHAWGDWQFKNKSPRILGGALTPSYQKNFVCMFFVVFTVLSMGTLDFVWN